MENNKVYGFDIDKYTADEIIEKTGIASFEDDQLKDAFLECVNNIEFAQRNEKESKREEIYLSTSPTAYAVFKRFYCDVKRYINLKNPSLKTDHLPDSLQFWTYPVAINLLHIQMLKDKLCKPLVEMGEGSYVTKM